MMKIRIISLHLAFGGVEKAITNMANIFCERYEVEIICMYDMPNAPAYPLDERVHVRYLMNEIPNREEFKAALHRKNIFQILKEGSKAIRILRNKKKLLKREFQQIKDGILITTRHEDTMLLNQYGNSNVYKIAQLHHDHHLDEKMLQQFDEQYSNIDVFCLLTDQLRDEVQAHLQKNQRMKCVTVPNFLDHIPTMCDLEAKQPILIATGRLHQVKGFDRMLELMKMIHERCPQWKLQIIGDGELYATLNEKIQTDHMEAYVTLCGRKNSKEIEQLHQAASIYLMTSYSEGLPYVLLEAQSCALPIVSFDVRVGPRAVIHDGNDGYLIPDQNMEQFVEKTCLLATDKKLRDQMAKQAYENVAYFSKENVQKIWFELLEQAESRCEE